MSWVAAAAGVIAAIVTAWLAGRKNGAADARKDTLERAAKAESQRKEIDEKVSADPDLASRARRSGLVRDK